MDTVRFLLGAHTPPLAAGRPPPDGRPSHPPSQVAAAGGHAAPPSLEAAAPPPQSYMAPQPLRRLWPAGDGDLPGNDSDEVDSVVSGPAADRRRGNWVMKIMRIRSLWAAEQGRGGDEGESMEEVDDRCAECGGGSEGCAAEGREEDAAAVDREMFSKLLRRVSLAEAELYAKMSYLSNLAYNIPNIKHANLLKFHGLRFVTSSFEKRAKSSSSDEILAEEQAPDARSGESDGETENKLGESDGEMDDKSGESDNGINASTAYQIAVSGISYLQSQTKGILPFGSAKPDASKDSPEAVNGSEVRCNIASSQMASFVATTNSVTAVVAGKEEMKQAVAEDLNSAQSSPCEWYVCDEVSSGTRYFVIQGSESLASWQANLLFEPIQFEDLDVIVHRGIYEAAKGIYQQMLPEIQDHLKTCGNTATLRLTGHSLGGSLALLVNLMLLIRGDAPSSSLLPVINFGAPSVMCGGDYLLQKLGLPQNHVQAITMHRDIVPRAFSCNYPDHVAKILTTINGKFRNHPCLKNQKMLYAPMGNLLILQPEEKFSPHHQLLPPGTGLYLFGHPLANSDDSTKQLKAAQFAFLNSPHPLEILSDRSAYGSEGTVYRDHDMNAYLRSVRGVIRQELKLIRKAKRELRRTLWWPLVSTHGVQSDVVTGDPPRLTDNGTHGVQSDVVTGDPPRLSDNGAHKFSFGGVVRGGKETLKRFGRIVTSQHLHMFIVFLVPARVLLLGTLSFVDLR